LLSVFVVLELGSVDSDDVSYSLDDWKIVKILREEHNVDGVQLPSLGDSGRISNLAGYNVSLLPLVREGSVNDDSIEMIRVFLSSFCLLLNATELRVLVVVL
jgi:hypothetical protein